MLIEWDASEVYSFGQCSDQRGISYSGLGIVSSFERFLIFDGKSKRCSLQLWPMEGLIMIQKTPFNLAMHLTFCIQYKVSNCPSCIWLWMLLIPLFGQITGYDAHDKR